MRIKLNISEPWELGEAIGWRALTGVQLQLDDFEGLERALVRLDEPISFDGNDWTYVVCTPRHSHDRLSKLDRTQSIMCAIMGISATQAMSDRPMQIDSWRGGLACIGDIALADQ